MRSALPRSPEDEVADHVGLHLCKRDQDATLARSLLTQRRYTDPNVPGKYTAAIPALLPTASGVRVATRYMSGKLRRLADQTTYVPSD